MLLDAYLIKIGNGNSKDDPSFCSIKLGKRQLEISCQCWY